MKYTKDEYPNLFEDILEFEVDKTVDDHRKGSSFFRESIIEFTDDTHVGYAGLYKTNLYIWDELNGVEDLNELIPIERVWKERVFNEMSYKEI